MHSRQSFFTTLLVLLVASLSAVATPLRLSSLLERRLAEELRLAPALSRRDVVVPKITSPDANSVWPIGSKQTVTWDTSNFPPYEQITNPIGIVLLGWDSGDSLNLQLDNPLAEGFQITDGQVEVTVPRVRPRKDYLIVLMGNSGNTSPSFAITSISEGTNSTTTSSRPSTSSTTTRTSPTTSPDATTTSTIVEPIPSSGTTTTGADPSTNTTIPAVVETTTASLTDSPAPTATTVDQANSEETTPLNAGRSLSSLRSCSSLAIGFLVAAAVFI